MLARRSLTRTLAVLIASLYMLGLAGCSGARSSFAPASDAGAAPEMAAEMERAEAQAAEGTGAGISRKVVATADLELVVADTDAAVEAINALVDEIGGYIATANLYKSSYGGAELLRGSLTVRVPAAEMEQTLSKLEALATDVRSKNVDRQDVTEQYSDIEAQLRNLQATENELRELLADVRAKPNATPEDILAVHRSLTEIRGEIETLQGRKNVLDNQISLSTIEVFLIPDAANRPVVEEGWRPMVVALDAIRALLEALQVLGNVVIWVAIFLLPLVALALIVLGILFFIVRGVLRWLTRRAKRPAPDATS